MKMFERTILIILSPALFLFIFIKELKRAFKNFTMSEFKKEFKHFWNNPDKII